MFLNWRKSFDGASLGNEWYFSDWYGTFNVSLSPWIFHNQHEFQFAVEGSNAGEMFIYDHASSDWWWTSTSSYPNFYSLNRSSWNFHFMDTVSPRQFVDLETGSFWSDAF